MNYGGWDKPPQFIVPGTASFLGQMRDLHSHMRQVHFGGARLEINSRLPRVPCINFMADADMYKAALRQASAFVQQLAVPCFNHPDAVAATGRDAVARALAGIEGVHMPVTVKVRADRLAQLHAAMDEAGISYPVLVRMAGDHNGASTVRVHDASDWEAINPLPWGGRDVYLTQYVDYQDADGRFRKMRLVVVGGQVIGRHCYISGEWLVHRKKRLPDSDDEETAFIRDFDRDTLPHVAAPVAEVARRLGLDYFGIDASLRPDGRLLVFEANATMNILSVDADGPEIWASVSARVEAALRELLGQPRRWRGAPAAGAASVEPGV